MAASVKSGKSYLSKDKLATMNKEFENKLKDIQDQFSKFGSEVQKTKLA